MRRENFLNFDQENAGERDMQKYSTMYSAEDRIRRGGTMGGGRNREGAGILSRPSEKGRRDLKVSARPETCGTEFRRSASGRKVLESPTLWQRIFGSVESGRSTENGRTKRGGFGSERMATTTTG